MNQKVYFKILHDQMLPFGQYLNDEYTVPIFKMAPAKFLLLQEYVTGLINPDTLCYILIDLQKSPDLSLTENLWTCFPQRVKLRKYCAIW